MKPTWRAAGRLLRWLGEVVRYSLAAFACFLLDIGALIALRTWTPLPLALDAALAFSLAAVLNFVLNRQWVFPRQGRAGRAPADFARYLALVVAGLLVTTVVVPLLTGVGLDYRVAKLSASGLVAIINFVIVPRWVFRPRVRRELTSGDAPVRSGL